MRPRIFLTEGFHPSGRPELRRGVNALKQGYPGVISRVCQKAPISRELRLSATAPPKPFERPSLDSTVNRITNRPALQEIL